MEQRKLIRLGNSSFAIALPKDWIDKSGLKKGDDVFVERNSNGEIIISSSFKKNEDKKIEINTENLDEYALEKELQSAYVKGYKEFHFVGKNNQSMKKAISNLKTNLLSLEFSENGKEKLVLKDLLNLEEINIDNFIRRIDNNLREGFEMILKKLNLGKMNKNELDEIRKIDDDINKVYMLISRVFILGLSNPSILSMLKLDSTELFNKWWFSFNLEHIGDDIKTIAKIMLNSNAESSVAITSLLEDIQTIYHESMESFYKQDKKLALTSMKKSRALFDKHKKEEFKSPVHLKIAENLKTLEDSCYQNLKMTMYMRA